MKYRRNTIFFLSLFTLMFLMGTNAEAATTTGMPWEIPLNNLLNSLTGPVARVIGAISIVVFGFGLAFSEGGGLIRRAMWIVLGLTIAFNALSWSLTFFGFTGGLLI